MKQTDLQGETERALRALSDKIADRFKYFINEKQLAEVLTAELLPLFNAGMAGAYAAAAKAVKNVEFTYSPDSTPRQEAIAAILALTPADARQAQTEHENEIIELEIAHANKRVEAEADYWKRNHAAAIASAEARARLEEAKEAFIRRYGIDNWDHVVATEYAFNECVVLDARRICHLEAVARTPDSAKEPE